MKVYGIYKGNVYGGGCVHTPLYQNKSDAKREAQKLYLHHVEEYKSRVENSIMEDDSFSWRICEDNPGMRWTNDIDQIVICEYEVI